MMTQPSVVRLIEVIRTQLSEIVGPALTDDGPRSTLGMIDHVLQTLQTRSEREIDWMITQSKDTIDLAQRAVAAGEVSSSVSDAVDVYSVNRADGLANSLVTTDYARAASVLSLILEETVGASSDIAAEARELLAREVQWGVDVVGEFVLVAP